MQEYCNTLTQYSRLKTKEVRIGNLLLGNFHPIRLQTMTTTDTMDTMGTVEQSIRCIEAGAELIRITAPSKLEAENLLLIKEELRKRGYETPLIADIHFTPNAAEIAARIVEKVRVNPGNYVDKKKFQLLEYTDTEYVEEIERIQERFTPLVRICKEYGTAMRIGTNHGSLSDRIMSRYGDTPLGMVESAMEFLRIARYESYHNIVLSMKSSNPQVMVQAYRLLIHHMQEEFGECYPLHLGVTEAGDGEDGRIKSAIGIGTLLEDGIGDTVRVSLTEDPEFEIPVCKDLVKRYTRTTLDSGIPSLEKLTYQPFAYQRRHSFSIGNVGGKQVPVVVADFSCFASIQPTDLQSIGYTYSVELDKWNISDSAADYLYLGTRVLDFSLPGTLKVIVSSSIWSSELDSTIYYPIFDINDYLSATSRSGTINFVMVDAYTKEAVADTLLLKVAEDATVVFCVSSENVLPMLAMRRLLIQFQLLQINNPVILISESSWQTPDEHLIHFSIETGGLLLDGFGDGICLGLSKAASKESIAANTGGRNYLQNKSVEEFINNTAFSILQATRTRISKTEYISCPSCGRTLFELQETTARIRAVTNHLKGVKIAIMGCIVNGPGEMADADFGYVGSGVGKITLYKGKEVVKRNIDSAIAVDELIQLIQESGAWVEVG